MLGNRTCMSKTVPYPDHALGREPGPHRQTETDRDRQRQTDRQIDGQTYGQRHRQPATERQRQRERKRDRETEVGRQSRHKQRTAHCSCQVPCARLSPKATNTLPPSLIQPQMVRLRALIAGCPGWPGALSLTYYVLSWLTELERQHVNESLLTKAPPQSTLASRARLPLLLG